jgi:hypothetical protein
MDGPVVTAAERALEAKDANLALAYVPKDGEDEVTRAFEAALRIREQGSSVREVADLHFFETVVRVHRAGEGAPYTGLKPAGLEHGPVIPVAERATRAARRSGSSSCSPPGSRRRCALRTTACTGPGATA